MKMFLQLKTKRFIFFINQRLFYLKLLIHENDQDSALHVVDSGHIGYRKFDPDIGTTVISLAIYFFLVS